MSTDRRQLIMIRVRKLFFARERYTNNCSLGHCNATLPVDKKYSLPSRKLSYPFTIEVRRSWIVITDYDCASPVITLLSLLFTTVLGCIHTNIWYFCQSFSERNIFTLPTSIIRLSRLSVSCSQSYVHLIFSCQSLSARNSSIRVMPPSLMLFMLKLLLLVFKLQHRDKWFIMVLMLNMNMNTWWTVREV